MNSSSYNYNPIDSSASYFLLENDMDDDTISTKPNLDPNYNCCYSSSSYTCSSFFPNSPQKYYSEFDLYDESLHLQHISHHLLSDTEILDNNPHHLFGSSPSPPVLKPAPKMISSSLNRSSKKDRHSKIKTANGLRDRRMRLSLDVAKRFFNLQDMLGYDKASHTINWLLKNSFPAIRDLERERLGTNNTFSGTNQNCNVEAAAGSSGLDALSGISWENAAAFLNVKKKTKRKLATRATVEKESRTKARERARARTSQKRRLTVRLQETSEIFASEPAWIHPSTAAFGNPLYNRMDGLIDELTHDLAEIQFPDKPWET